MERTIISVLCAVLAWGVGFFFGFRHGMDYMRYTLKIVMCKFQQALEQEQEGDDVE